MAEDEILDQVDKDGNVIGQAPRHVFHSNPSMIHPVVHCWVFNKKGEVLWQQRSLQKATSPGKWDMSCGGHILSGHNAEETIVRELDEELGLKNIKCTLVDRYIRGNEKQTEFVYLYFAIADVDVSELTLQEIEVEKVEWIDPSLAQDMVLKGERESTEYIFSQVTKILTYRLLNN